MPPKRRRFTAEEKLAILHEAKQMGTTPVLHKHNLSYSVFHRWREMFSEGVTRKIRNEIQVNSTVKDLLQENALLKKIIANQAVLLELKEEELRGRR